MRTSIYFVRHAEAQSNVDPLFRGDVNTLTDRGQQQAIAVGARLAHLPLERIYTSMTLRAQLTAREIASAAKQEVVELDFLKERKTVYSSPTEYHHVESFEDLRIRLDKARDFFERLPSKKIAIVSHAIFLKSLIAHILLGGAANEEQLLQIADTLVIDHGSISTLEYHHEKRRWHLLCLNDQSHMHTT